MSSSPQITIVGAGVIGLSCGISLLEGGFSNVQIIAESFSPHTTSDIAAAIWRPSHVESEHLAKWCEASLEKLGSLSKTKPSGVKYITRTEFYRQFKAPIWHNLVEQVKPAIKMPEAYQECVSYKVPLMDTTIYMSYLLESYKKLGGRVAVTSIKNFQEIKEADVIVNCTGLGARVCAKDESLYPIQGQVVVVERPARFTASLAAPEDFIYINSRQHDCVIGGTAEVGSWETKPDPALAKKILQRAIKLYPALAKQAVLGHKVGLRPGRPSIRLESDWDAEGRLLIHNYGHGGAGHTLSWGCARSVLELIIFGG
ncbi:MAG: D-amino-acid oxidase [Gammaproteobacteria bacterium]|jgi:D-amino-acid oxidase|nr:D-amino-acid oxidase [Gammaproteobacteria bacterium]